MSMDSFDLDKYLLAGPRLKSVVVAGGPGTYGWSKRLQKAAGCIVARWESGDRISDWELGWHLGQFVRAGKITEAQRSEFSGAIRRLDKDKGGAEDLRSVRALGKIIAMKVVVKAIEPPLQEVKPGPYPMTYPQAYRLARFIRKSTQELEVRVVRTGDEDHESPTTSWWRSPPGSYTVKVGPPHHGRKAEMMT